MVLAEREKGGEMAASVEGGEGLGRQIERRSIDYVPEDERHGKVWHQGPFWFLGNFQFFTITIGFIGPGLGLSLGWTILAGTLGILFGTLFMADRKSTRLNSSHANISYAAFCLKKQKYVFTMNRFTNEMA